MQIVKEASHRIQIAIISIDDSLQTWPRDKDRDQRVDRSKNRNGDEVASGHHWQDDRKDHKLFECSGSATSPKSFSVSAKLFIIEMLNHVRIWVTSLFVAYASAYQKTSH